MNLLKNRYVIILAALFVGFLAGKKSGPERVEISEDLKKKESIISDLQNRIESLQRENLKENEKTVIVESPDGTRTTTKTRTTEKTTEVAKLSEEKKSSLETSEVESKKKTVETYSSNHNAIGLRPSYKLFYDFETEVYVKAGMKCFIFECYAEGSYSIVSKTPKVSVGIEYRF